MTRLSDQVADLETDRDRLTADIDALTARVQQLLAAEAERDELLRLRGSKVPELVAREIYRRGYRAGYSSARRCTNKRGPYRRTRDLVA